MSQVPSIHIDAIAPRQACMLVARAMRDNPTHIAVFGNDADRRQRRLQNFFSALLPWIAANGILLGAFEGEEPVAVLGLLPPQRCRPGPRQLLRMGRRLVLGQNPFRLFLMLRWLYVWSRNDPLVPHWHLGPLAVAPSHQGRGIGSQLTLAGLVKTEAQRVFCHLETDRERNVQLYRRLGFVVVAERQVVGVPNWFMQRPSGQDWAAAGHPSRTVEQQSHRP